MGTGAWEGVIRHQNQPARPISHILESPVTCRQRWVGGWGRQTCERHFYLVVFWKGVFLPPSPGRISGGEGPATRLRCMNVVPETQGGEFRR